MIVEPMAVICLNRSALGLNGCFRFLSNLRIAESVSRFRFAPFYVCTIACSTPSLIDAMDNNLNVTGLQQDIGRNQPSVIPNKLSFDGCSQYVGIRIPSLFLGKNRSLCPIQDQAGLQVQGRKQHDVVHRHGPTLGTF